MKIKENKVSSSENQFLSPEYASLSRRFLDSGLENISGNSVDSLLCSVNVFGDGIPVNFLSCPQSSRQAGCSSVICCGDFFDVYVKSSSFSFQGFRNRAVLIFSDAKTQQWKKN